MQSGLGILALIVAVAAAGVSGYALMQERTRASDLEARLEVLEDQVERMESPAGRKGAEEVSAPTLIGIGPLRATPPGSRADEPEMGGERRERSLSRTGRTAESAEGVSAGSAEKLEAMVEKAVERKASQLQVMQKNKKPPIDLFAKTIELTDEQRYAAERAIVSSQHEIKSILEIETEDGTNFLNELVEIMADGMANPGKNPGRGLKLFGRLLTEKVPGSNETYAAHAEAVKQRLRDNFKRDWDEKQYARFESWQMDPTEVQGIEGSPWKEVETQVIERAKQLGADIPTPENR